GSQLALSISQFSLSIIQLTVFRKVFLTQFHRFEKNLPMPSQRSLSQPAASPKKVNTGLITLFQAHLMPLPRLLKAQPMALKMCLRTLFQSHRAIRPKNRNTGAMMPWYMVRMVLEIRPQLSRIHLKTFFRTLFHSHLAIRAK